MSTFTLKINKIEVEIDTYDVARAINPENLADIIEDNLNNYDSAYNKGRKVGLHMTSKHRTLQGSFGEWIFGVIEAMAETKYWDVRNEDTIQNFKTIAEMRKNDQLKHQPLI